MELVSAATRTKLLQLQTLRVVLLVLGGSIGSLLALGASKMNDVPSVTFLSHGYSIMRVKVPAPTVLPPSLIAKRKPVSKATG